MHSGSRDGSDDESVGGGLDAFAYASPPPHEADTDDPTVPIVLTVSVTNPAGTVCATATISGSLQHVELQPDVVSMTEFDLARDILATAELASMKGRAGQRNLVEGMLIHQGLDRHAARDYMDQYMNLPTADQAEAAAAEARTRYRHGEY